MILESELLDILNSECNKKLKRNNTYSINNFKDNTFFFQHLSDKTVNKLSSFIKKISITNNFDFNSLNKHLIYIVKGGVIRINTETNMEVLYEKNNVIGEEELFFDNEINYNFKINEKGSICDILSIPYTILKAYIGKNLKDHISNYLSNVKFNNLIVLKEMKLCLFLGKGTYGCVNLVVNTLNNQFYALKSISKSKIIKNKAIFKYLKSEKTLLTSFSSPFVLNAKSTLQDSYFCHFVLEYVEGHSLDHLVKRKLIEGKSEECIFYFANIIIILEALRLKQVVHRDIKPANLMVCKNGYLKVIDFGLSKHLFREGYTYTIIGSPYFIAPEVIKGVGYGRSCDYWAAGVTLYKMYYGKYPFGDEGNNSLDVYKSIINDSLAFPYSENSGSIPIKSILRMIVMKELTNRPTSLSEIRSSMSSIYPIDWDNIMELNKQPPIIKVVSNIKNKLELIYNKEDFHTYSNTGELPETGYKGIQYNPKLIKNHFNQEIHSLTEKEDDLFNSF